MTNLTAMLAEKGSNVLIYEDENETLVGWLTEFESILEAIGLMARINNGSELQALYCRGTLSVLRGSDLDEENVTWDWVELVTDDKSLCLVETMTNFDDEVALAEAIVKQVNGGQA